MGSAQYVINVKQEVVSLNKRQQKKRIKIINERVDFCNNNIIVCGNKKNKNMTHNALQQIVYGKSYEKFKNLRQMVLKGQLNLEV